MKIIVLFAASLIFISSFAQSNLKPGFIVKNTGDTVRGLIEEVEVKKLSNKISFSSTNAQTGDFTTSDINGFGYDGGNSFQKISNRYKSYLIWGDRLQYIPRSSVA